MRLAWVERRSTLSLPLRPTPLFPVTAFSGSISRKSLLLLSRHLPSYTEVASLRSSASQLSPLPSNQEISALTTTRHPFGQPSKLPSASSACAYRPSGRCWAASSASWESCLLTAIHRNHRTPGSVQHLDAPGFRARAPQAG